VQTVKLKVRVTKKIYASWYDFFNKIRRKTTLKVYAFIVCYKIIVYPVTDGENETQINSIETIQNKTIIIVLSVIKEE